MIEGYTLDVDAGLIRSKERGLPAQRRVFSTMPHSVKCKFALSLREWGLWQEWIKREGLGWFYLDLATMYAGQQAARVIPHLVRLMAPITIDSKSATHITASCTFEISPSMFKQYLAAT
jgi:hypothetical protein